MAIGNLARPLRGDAVSGLKLGVGSLACSMRLSQNAAVELLAGQRIIAGHDSNILTVTIDPVL